MIQQPNKTSLISWLICGLCLLICQCNHSLISGSGSSFVLAAEMIANQPHTHSNPAVHHNRHHLHHHQFATRARTLAIDENGGGPAANAAAGAAASANQQAQPAQLAPSAASKSNDAGRLPKLPKINIYLGRNEIKRLLGIDTPINYVSEGNINTYPLGFSIPLGYNQSDMIFTWQNLGQTNVNYSISLALSNDKAVNAPIINITRNGLIPKHEQVFRITLPCSGRVTTEVDVEVFINISGLIPVEEADGDDDDLDREEAAAAAAAGEHEPSSSEDQEHDSDGTADDLELDKQHRAPPAAPQPSQQQPAMAAAGGTATLAANGTAAAAAAIEGGARNSTTTTPAAGDDSLKNQMQSDQASEPAAPVIRMRQVSHTLAIKRKKICTMHPVLVQPNIHPATQLPASPQPARQPPPHPATLANAPASNGNKWLQSGAAAVESSSSSSSTGQMMVTNVSPIKQQPQQALGGQGSNQAADSRHGPPEPPAVVGPPSSLQQQPPHEMPAVSAPFTPSLLPLQPPPLPLPLPLPPSARARGHQEQQQQQQPQQPPPAGLQYPNWGPFAPATAGKMAPENPLNELLHIAGSPTRHHSTIVMQTATATAASGSSSGGGGQPASPPLVPVLALLSLLISIALIVVVLLGSSSSSLSSSSSGPSKHRPIFPLNKLNALTRCLLGGRAQAAAVAAAAATSARHHSHRQHPSGTGIKPGAIVVNSLRAGLKSSAPSSLSGLSGISGHSQAANCYKTTTSYQHHYYGQQPFGANNNNNHNSSSSPAHYHQQPPTADLLGTGYQCHSAASASSNGGGQQQPHYQPIYHIATGSQAQTTRLIWNNGTGTSPDGFTIDGQYMPLSNHAPRSDHSGSVYQTIY